MANNKNGNLWILILVCMGCIIISTVAYVVMKARMQNEFLAVTVTVAVAITLCVCAWQIFTQLENMVPKSERERIKAEKLAEDARKKRLAEVQGHEVSQPETQQPQIVIQNTIVNQHEIINEVNTEVVNNVINDISNENVNVAEANAPTEVKAESPTVNVTPSEVKAGPSMPNVEAPQPTPTAPFANIPDVDTTVGGESYLDTIAAHEQARKKREADRVNAIMAYLKIAMPPFMPQDQLRQLLREVMEWIKDPEYRPANGVCAYKEFTTLDARHLICNISTRLSNSHGGHNRSWLVKTLFAETCRELEEPAIYKNMRLNPMQGHIKIDDPDEDGIAFHYELLEHCRSN